VINVNLFYLFEASFLAQPSASTHLIRALGDDILRVRFAKSPAASRLTYQICETTHQLLVILVTNWKKMREKNVETQHVPTVLSITCSLEPILEQLILGSVKFSSSPRAISPINWHRLLTWNALVLLGKS
jgi:hypothetical protein